MCVGHVALDMMFGVHAFPAHPTKTPAHHHHQGVGGMSANAAVALARLGADVAFCGPVGDDAAADVFARHFQREGVDASRMQRLSGHSSSVSAIIIDGQGERMIFNHRGSALTADAAFDPAWLTGCQALWVDPRCPAWALQALQWARTHGVPSMLDGDISPAQDLTALVPWADWVVFSEAGLIHAYGVGGEAGLDRALEACRSAFATAAGMAGGAGDRHLGRGRRVPRRLGLGLVGGLGRHSRHALGQCSGGTQVFAAQGNFGCTHARRGGCFFGPSGCAPQWLRPPLRCVTRAQAIHQTWGSGTQSPKLWRARVMPV